MDKDSLQRFLLPFTEDIDVYVELGGIPCRIERASYINTNGDGAVLLHLADSGYTKRGEVMKTPESAAQGSEAGHLNTPHRDGTGAVPGGNSMGTEAQATQPSAAPTLGDPCHVCKWARIEQSGYNFRCANCGWLGPRVPWAPSTSSEEHK